MRRMDRQSASGVALIAVLWCLALLTVLATAVTALSVSHRRAAQRYGESVVLDARADSALRVAVLRIVAPKGPGGSDAARADLHVDLPDGEAEVWIEREDGRIDLNTADENLIYAFFAANGWELKAARAMAARIADWKDADDEARENGAEAAAYLAAGLPYGPRNGPFEVTDELRQVLGAHDLNAELLGAFTVYSHSAVPRASNAPAPVKRALKFADEHQLGEHRWLPASESIVASGVNDDAHTFVGEVVRLRACTKSAVGQRCRLLVARLTGSRQRPLQIYIWKSTSPPFDDHY